MKVIFFGTPDFAVKPLKAIINEHEVLAVVTQPDKPVGRSNKPVFSPVKQCAIENNIPVLQYEKVRRDGVEELKSLNADVMVSCAYGQIFSEEIINITKHGIYNIHASILPKYRGAAPIQWSIINGDKQTGVTIMKTNIGLDDGDILLIEKVDILPNETSGQLFDRLSDVGANAIVKALRLIESGKYNLIPQNHSEATTCKMLSSELSVLNFNNKAQQLVNLIHGINPWPVAKVDIGGIIFKVFTACVRNDYSGKAGSVLVANNKQGLIIACGDYAIELLEIQPQNGKRMTSKSYLNGKTINVGDLVK